MCLCSSCPAGTCDGCTFHFLWESSSACPLCTEDDYHRIEGACKGSVQVTLYMIYGTKSLLAQERNVEILPLFPSTLSRKLCTCGTSRSCAPKVCRCLPGAPLRVRPSLCGWRSGSGAEPSWPCCSSLSPAISGRKTRGDAITNILIKITFNCYLKVEMSAAVCQWE